MVGHFKIAVNGLGAARHTHSHPAYLSHSHCQSLVLLRNLRVAIASEPAVLRLPGGAKPPFQFGFNLKTEIEIGCLFEMSGQHTEEKEGCRTNTEMPLRNHEPALWATHGSAYQTMRIQVYAPLYSLSYLLLSLIKQSLGSPYPVQEGNSGWEYRQLCFQVPHGNPPLCSHNVMRKKGGIPWQPPLKPGCCFFPKVSHHLVWRHVC